MLAVANGADDAEVCLFQNPREAVGDNRVVVGKEDGGPTHHVTCPSPPASTLVFRRPFTGIVARTRVP